MGKLKWKVKPETAMQEKKKKTVDNPTGLSDPVGEVDAEVNTDSFPSAEGALFPWQSGVTKFTVNHDARSLSLTTR